MSTHKVQMLAGGMANWGTPVKKSESLSICCYEAFLMFRFTLDNGDMIHMPGCISGMDDINAKGDVPSGVGFIQLYDEQHDQLLCKVEWFDEGGSERGGGRFTFSHGTGKWAGVSGEIVAQLWGAPARPTTVLPPTGPIQFCGFLDGKGELKLPNYRK